MDENYSLHRSVCRAAAAAVIRELYAMVIATVHRSSFFLYNVIIFLTQPMVTRC